jgi:hypothetical protein
MESSTAAAAAATDIDRLLNKAERSFLRKDYRQALVFVNEAFGFLERDESISKVSQTSNEDIVTLSPSIRVPPQIESTLIAENNRKSRTYQFTVVKTAKLSSRRYSRCRCQPPPQEYRRVADDLASIGLQSWHELSMKERKSSPAATTSSETAIHIATSNEGWKFLKPIVQYYSLNNVNKRSGHAISMGLLLVWIPFWESHGYEKEAFLWTAQVLMAAAAADNDHVEDANEEKKDTADNESGNTTQIGKNNLESKSLEELLWLHCICNQLPHVHDSQFALQILKVVSTGATISPDTISIETVERKWSTQSISRETLNSLLSFLESIETNDASISISSRSIIKAIEWLSKQHQECEDPKNIKKNVNTTKRERPPDSATALSSLNSDASTGSETESSTIITLPDESLSWAVSPACPKVDESRIFVWFKRTVYDLAEMIKGDKTKLRTIVAQLFVAGGENFGSNRNNDSAISSVRGRISTAAFSVAILLLSWRHRRLFSRISSSLAWGLLAPIKELVDALLMGASSSGGTPQGNKSTTQVENFRG